MLCNVGHDAVFIFHPFGVVADQAAPVVIMFDITLPEGCFFRGSVRFVFGYVCEQAGETFGRVIRKVLHAVDAFGVV